MRDPNRHDETVDWSDSQRTTRGVPSSAVAHPQHVGRYRIERVLGNGAFGVVYLAFDEQVQRYVAVKTPHAEFVRNPDVAGEYLSEARAVGGLDHPHIVPVYDVGSTPDCACFIVSKFIEGTTLAQRIESGRIGLLDAVAISASIAEAIHYAHTHGVVHRDLKPGNVLVDAAGVPHVVDFGLALKDEVVDDAPRFVGTPAYTSPEQARGEGHRVDGRSDIFSLGVILYEMIVNRRPFRGTTRGEVLDRVIGYEPRPPRQIDDTIPKELERICLKAMAKRSSDRYTTAKDMADDLNLLLARLRGEMLDSPGDSSAASDSQSSRSASISGNSNGGTNGGHSSTFQQSEIAEPIRIVPKGLRAFEANDSDFFLELLPGPRGRDGLPESIRFWKTRIDNTDCATTFSVGLLYGPSGCGKTSLVRAGLLPRLESHVRVVYIEATKRDTTKRLLQRLRTLGLDLPANLTLTQTLSAIRRGQGLEASGKLFFVIDQFEQWLHSNGDREGSELADALRQCDGGRVQCLLMVRDDYWMSATRLMRELEVRLIDGQNANSVDLFQVKHAKRVLAAFGRAHEDLPERLQQMTADHQRFIDQAVEQLSVANRVVCVHLAIFSEMVKGKPWTPATLRQLGGAQGVGVAFLEETFAGADASPTCKLHEEAARAVLQALLPEPGSDIRGRRRSHRELREASGYPQTTKFEELLRLLDNELRLITPVDPPDETQRQDSPRDTQAYYQLTHDYLVPALREWLDRKQKETRRGRAALRLHDLAALWNAKPESRHLPSTWEYLTIRRYVPRAQWVDSERRMMSAATRRVASIWSGIALGLLGLIVGLVGTRMYLQNVADVRRAESLVERLLDANISETPEIIRDMRPYRRWTNPQLHGVIKSLASDDPQRLHASLALVDDDPALAKYLLDVALVAPPTTLTVIRERLQNRASELVQPLWRTIADDDAGQDVRFRAACLLAGFDPNSSNWNKHGPFVAHALANQNVLTALDWTETLMPVATHLTPTCIDICRDPDHKFGEDARLNAAHAVAKYASDDVSLLADLAVRADARPFAALLPALSEHQSPAAEFMRRQLQESRDPVWPDDERLASFPTPSPELQRQLDLAAGRLESGFAYCQTLALSDFDEIADQMFACGYRPVCFRPYVAKQQQRVAAVWHRDGRKWELSSNVTAEQLLADDHNQRQHGLVCVDFASWTPVGGKLAGPVFAGVWSDGDSLFEILDSSLYVAVSENDHASKWQPLNEARFVPRTNLKYLTNESDALYSSLRWRVRLPPEYRDTWDEYPQDYQQRCDEFLTQIDVRLGLDKDGSGHPAIAGTWWNGVPYASRQILTDSLDQHTLLARDLTNEGYRPIAISVQPSDESGLLHAASVWLRPMPDENWLDEIASRQANAAVALLHFGEAPNVWPLLASDVDPRVRSYLIDRLAAFRVSPQLLATRFETTTNAAERRALLLVLSNFQLDDLRPATRTALTERIRDACLREPDAGLHAAAEYLARRWGIDSSPANADEATTGNTDPADDNHARRWLTTSEGHTLSIIPAPVEFILGSAPNEPGRDHPSELQQRVQIVSSFAISTCEVTVAQFLRFKPDHVYAADYSPNEDCPINEVTWFDAARYCRWLSEQESVPEHEMCFPALDEIGEGMKLPDDYLRRQGYRLPTDAEWEFACRANTHTPRYFGWQPELLDDYAWTASNASYRSRPVGQLIPNDWGLFDAYGNVMEMTASRRDSRSGSAGPTALLDFVRTDSMLNDTQLMSRGGAFLYQPLNARSAHVDWHFANSRRPYLGFRIARTLAAPTDPQRQ